jgi:hypothetical protein
VAPDAAPDVKSGMYDILRQASINRITFQDDDIRKITDGGMANVLLAKKQLERMPFATSLLSTHCRKLLPL